jgi:hypothetical protein
MGPRASLGAVPCSTSGTDKMHTKFWSDTLKGRDHSECEDNTRMDPREAGSECVEWMQLAQDTAPRAPKKAGGSLLVSRQTITL